VIFGRNPGISRAKLNIESDPNRSPLLPNWPSITSYQCRVEFTSPEIVMTRFFLSLLSVAALGLSVRADDTADFLKPENWQSLPQLWKVDGTTITGKTDKDLKFNTFLCSKAKYADFELSCKAKITGGKGNTGIQVRSAIVEAEKDKFVVAGPQCDMGQQYWGSLYGEKFAKDGKLPGAGHMLKACPADFVKKHVKADDFNDYKLTVKGKKVTIVVNGETTVDGEFAIIPAEGIIAFQLHAGGAMETTFKDIKFKVLK
jgi:hypothetical protein